MDKETNARKDISIQITRIVAMFSIIICHLLQEVGNEKIATLSQFFNVGVYIFLFLSGYLYGNKNIKEPAKWLFKRFIKLMIPIYIFMIVIFGIQLYQHTFQPKYLLIYLFNLQRIFGTTSGAGHLWFMTVIMFCYFITPILNKLKNKICNNDVFLLIWYILSCLICYIHGDTGQIFLYMFVYLFGYCYRNRKNKISINNLVCIAIIVISIIIRLLGKRAFDGTVIYDRIIVSITHLILAFMIFQLLSNIFRNKNIGKYHKIINHLDNISFYLYLTHSVFMVGPIRLMGITNYLSLNIILTLIASYLSALILFYLTKLINKKIKI